MAGVCGLAKAQCGMADPPVPMRLSGMARLHGMAG
jgi:hypothetical protein